MTTGNKDSLCDVPVLAGDKIRGFPGCCDYCGHQPENCDCDLNDEPTCCHTCGGDGFVMSLVEETGRHGWDDDAPGKCPNCNGSGKGDDCTYW